jgi:hypothetical protein
VRDPDELGRLREIRDRGQLDAEPDRELERPVLAGVEHHVGLDGDVGDLLRRQLDAARGGGHDRLEAGGVADGEELLGVDAVAVAAELLGSRGRTSSRPSGVRPRSASRPPVTRASAV